MKKEQLVKAKIIEEGLWELESDLKRWEIQKKESGILYRNVSIQIFEKQKAECLSEIKKKKKDLEIEFAEI